MRIAIIGSGIAGLTAAWSLAPRHEVTLYEAHATFGMDAHSLDVDGERVDVPLRVFHDGYYPRLSALYAAAGVVSSPVDSSASFTTADGRLLFQYGNTRLGRHHVPLLTRAALRSPRAIRTGLEAARMLLVLRRERDRADVQAGMTFGEYLPRSPFSRAFARDFLVPAVAGICTCSYASVRAFPARVVLDYLDTPRTHTMRRVRAGVNQAAARLTERVTSLQLGTPVELVRRTDAGAEVTVPGRVPAHFDHVVIATRADQAPRLLDTTPAERRALEGFRYERSELVVHRDRALAPPRRAWWSPVNYVLDPDATAPMTTVLLTAIHPTEWQSTPVFQTWNPIREPHADTVLARAPVMRALVDAGTADAVRRLRALHDEPDRRVWFCGSYANEAMTLQESAVASALTVTARLGGRQP